MSRGGGGGGGGSLSMRWAQMAQQKEVIEQRKRMYLAKRAGESGRADEPSLNAFSNDGSFLDKFRKLADAKDAKTAPRPVKINAAPVRSVNRKKPEIERIERVERRRSRSRSGSRERKYDKRNRRKRSYSPCTPVVEDMPHRKPSRLANILPQPAPNIRFNMPGLAGMAAMAPPPDLSVPPPPLFVPHLPPVMPILPVLPAPPALPHLPPIPPPLDIPEPEPLDAISIPPPEPMNLQAIPPPLPICLTQIPKPKELDPRSIPRPPKSVPPDVLSADGRPSATMDAAAKQVAQNGDAWEYTLKTQSARADSLRFLRDEQSAEYKYYRSLVMKYRRIDEEAQEDDGEKYEPEFSLQDDSGSEDEKPRAAPVKISFEKSKIEPKEIDQDISKKIKEKLDYKSDEDEDVKKKDKAKKRRSRWGDTGEPAIPMPINTITVNSPPSVTPVISKVTRSDPGLLQYAMKTFGNTNLSEEDWKKCEDHYKINILYQEMLHKRNEIEKLKAAGKFKYEYDSDEEIDESGTWEHRLRQQEMEATQRWASELTRQATGKHHIGDFLPPDELKKFMDKYSSVKSGKEPDLSDYKEFKLKENNIGFKMLQKLGWSEGEGLGVDRSGIVEPVNKGAPNDSNHGLGVERVDSLAEGDDEFDAYRKRMMLAYRFRPNPLNNPRRPYY